MIWSSQVTRSISVPITLSGCAASAATCTSFCSDRKERICTALAKPTCLGPMMSLEQISAALERLRRGRTCFLIAHRLATVRTADRILVLQDGRIAEQGTHQQLLDAGGIYRVLYDAQFS